MVGLDSAEARRRLAAQGPNRPPEPRPRRLHERIWSQLRDPMILLLLAAGTLTAVLRDWPDTVIIVAVVVLNTLIGVVQEVRADRAVAALRDLTPAFTHVYRDGELVRVPIEEVVPGDVTALAAGDVVPADGDVVRAHDLQLDESMMTGEALPVARGEGSEVTGGTLLTRGRATVTLTRTGADSGLGRLAALLAATPTRATPLQRRLARLSRLLVLGVTVLTAVVVVMGLAQGRPLTEMAVVGVSLAVAAVPESLPAVVAVALALGAHRMAQRQAVVRRLPAVETLGSVTVIATDKTGTLTEGKMVAERVWTPMGEYTVETIGEEASGDGLARLLRDVVLCNDATLTGDEGAAAVIGDPLEGALLVLSGRAGTDPGGLQRTWPRTAEVPFDHLTRRMVSSHRHADGSLLTVCKGAPEAVLELVAQGDATQRARAAADALAADGYRVIAVAEQEAATETATDIDALRLVGLVGIDDPPRGHAPAVVAACRRAGIRLVLVTGDHPATAHAIARRVGILSGDPAADDGRTVHARVLPEQKVSLVEALQGEGEVVAMLGDGVNDAPALRRADIGVAAGLGGTEVARQAADLVLLDDDLSTVVAAVEEGRRILTNIRSFLLYAVSGGLAEVGVMLFGPAVGLAQPLLPAQILWINLLTHGVTGVAFGAEPADPADMERPPHPPEQSVITPRLATYIGVAAVALTVVALAVATTLEGEERQRTAAFLVLGLGQLGVALAIRSRAHRRGIRDRGLEVAVLGAVGLMVLGVVLAPLQALLGTATPAAEDLLVIVPAAIVPGILMAVVVRVARARQRRPAAGDGT